tara:strand:- start:116 stop:1612 length:1497 start_codon:yes stop_codon:yes gene_type:complete
MTEVISINKVEVGDHIIVKSGATIPVDGLVVAGNSDVSEALLTGEAIPKIKQCHDSVVAGSINNGNPLTIQATKVGDETTLATILKLFERAQYDKPSIVSLTQKFSHYFILLQVMTALALFLYWMPFSVEHAFWVTISLLVISCPCALAIATPIGLTASMNALSRVGFLCTRGHVLESLVNPTDIIFDKTGTLTEGEFSIQSVDLHAALTREQVLQVAASLESQSEHPIASAFKRDSQVISSENVVIHPNQGVEGDVQGVHYYLGNAAFIQSRVPGVISESINDTSYTKILMATDAKLLATIGLEDKLRVNAKTTINYLIEQGYSVHLLSGDNRQAVKHYAAMLGIKRFNASFSPTDKLNYVKSLQKGGASVVMLGDGINDAPVLMQAQVSIAMVTAADLTRVSADAVLMKNDLSILITVFNQVKKTHLIIKQCLVWAAVYNIICLPLAVSGMVAPYVAAALMSLSSILVVGNALRLMVVATPKKEEAIHHSFITAKI